MVEAVSQAPRHPTSLCPQAGLRLTELVGMALNASSAAALSHTDARQQCTHMIDLAGLAIAAAARDIGRRCYEAEAPDRVDGRSRPRLWCDGRLVLEWTIDKMTVVGPGPYAGRSLEAGFTAWTQAELDVDAAEAALVLRRACFISGGRGVDLDSPGRTFGPAGGCWVWQPEQAPQARRMVGSTLDFSETPEALTRDDQDWLAFAVD